MRPTSEINPLITPFINMPNLGNVGMIVKEIKRKVPLWLDDLDEGKMERNTLYYGIALKSAILFELLVQESARCLLQVFPDRAKYQFTWRTPEQLRRGINRCLAENIALLNLLQDDLEGLLPKTPPEPKIEGLLNGLRVARNRFVHPNPHALDAGDQQLVYWFMDGPEDSQHLINHLKTLDRLCDSGFIAAILSLEEHTKSFDDLTANFEHLPGWLQRV